MRRILFLFAAAMAILLAACDDSETLPGEGPLRVEAPEHLRKCRVDADCILASSTCIGCCDRAAVNRADSAAFEAFRRGACANSPNIVCGCCDIPAEPACRKGLCEMVLLADGCRP
jgi:hypothetical protein